MRVQNFLNDPFVTFLKPSFCCQLHSCYLIVFLGSGKASDFFLGIVIVLCLLIDICFFNQSENNTLNVMHLFIFYKMFWP